MDILYKTPEISILKNGNTTKSFVSTQRIQQRCPISSLLFVLVAITIRNEQRIQGILVDNKINITISQMADDTTLFSKDIASTKSCLDIVQQFEKCAGLKLYKEQTEAVQLGCTKNMIYLKCGLKWSNKPIKITRIWVGLQTDVLKSKAFEDMQIESKIKTFLATDIA